MATRTTDVAPLDILANALRAPSNRRALDDVSRYKNEIIDAVDAMDGESIQKIIETSGDPDWTEEVLSALDSTPAALDSEASDLQSIVEGDEREIGRMFGRWIEQLPLAFYEFEELQSLPGASESEQVRAAASPATIACGAVGARLARFGITPLTFFYAAQAVSNLISAAEKKNAVAKITKQDLIEEVAATCECSPEMARLLLIWLNRASDYIDVFPGLTTERQAGRIVFRARKPAPVAVSKARVVTPVARKADMEASPEAALPAEDDNFLRA